MLENVDINDSGYYLLDFKKCNVEKTSTIELQLNNLSEARSFADHLAKSINGPIAIALNGTLGAGKTQLARFFCESLGVPPDLVTSPTYVLLQRYKGSRFEVYHFDFYRLENELQVWDLGFDEIQESQAVLLVEWADKFPECLPPNRLEVSLTVDPADSLAGRRALIQGFGTQGRQILVRLAESLQA